MRITVVTVVYNNREFIEEAILSVLNQTYVQLEYIIIDGGSTDGTLDIIKKYESKISLFISEKDNGLYDAMNKAYDIATGDIIGILNSDDLFYNSDCIGKVVAAFQANSQTEIVYGDLIYVRRENVSEVVRHWKSGYFYDNYFADGWVPAHPSVYVKRHVADAEKYNLSIKFTADYDWLLRIFHKYRVNYLPEIIVRMRLGGLTSKSARNIILGNIEIAKSWKRNKGKYPIITLFLKRPLLKLKQLIISKKLAKL